MGTLVCGGRRVSYDGKAAHAEYLEATRINEEIIRQQRERIAELEAACREAQEAGYELQRELESERGACAASRLSNDFAVKNCWEVRQERDEARREVQLIYDKMCQLLACDCHCDACAALIHVRLTRTEKQDWIEREAGGA